MFNNNKLNLKLNKWKKKFKITKINLINYKKKNIIKLNIKLHIKII